MNEVFAFTETSSRCYGMLEAYEGAVLLQTSPPADEGDDDDDDDGDQSEQEASHMLLSFGGQL